MDQKANTMAPVLKYLFTAIFADGTSFTQQGDDVSSLVPGKNAFFDLQNMMLTKQLIIFMLKGNGQEHFVNLRTGHFQLGLHEFTVGKEPPPAPEVADLKIIYFMRVGEKRHLKIRIKDEEDGPGEIGDILEDRREEARTYCFGWEATTKEGKKIGPNIVGVD